jgi:hypothetical protein
MRRGPQPGQRPPADLTRLICELLDAHSDTIELICRDRPGSPGDLDWPAQLDYLRALQRRGKEILARAGAGELEVRAEPRR